MSTIKRYGLWTSPISIEAVFRQPASPSYPFRHRGNLYWLQMLPEEGGRIAVMKWMDEEPVCLTPLEFNIRTKVHEYGGKCFCLLGDTIVFNNFVDGRLYRQALEPNSTPVAITAEDDSSCGYADIVAMNCGRHVVAVFEQAVLESENSNQIVMVNVESSQAIPSVLISGCDFYAAPAISQEGDSIAWIEWNHPNMPWDTTRLCQGDLSHNGKGYICDKIERIINQEGASVCQPGYLHDGSLVYAYDSSDSDWWNLYRYDDGSITQLTDESAEFGEAHWVFGQTRWVQTGLDELVAIATDHCGDRLLGIDLNGNSTPILKVNESGVCHLQYCENKLLFVTMPEDRPGSIAELELSKEQLINIGPQSSPLIDNGYAAPEPMECPTTDGGRTFGYFYPPFNPGYVAPDDCLPPLVVMVHGGPTSRTNRSFHPLRQYFTTLGFAVFDINHRGSTGYGRNYRQRLLGEWGEVDCMDIADSIRYLVYQGRVDPDAIFIRGGSAGGYAVLRALTRLPELFAGGACYYGIGNLITLSEITHKFEARYTDRLVGEVYDPESARMPASRYVTRSPIFSMEQLNSPLILFQGLLDKVVPPEVSREVVSLLKKNGVPHAYTEYGQEGHGFRSLETRIDSLEKETTFFKEIIENSLSI